jgi:formiminotetrahydrofolate cyclodeaminase
MLVDRTLRELLDAFASPDPTPGGGSASAAASAIGASLLLMVAGLPKTRENSDDDRAALTAAASALTGIQHQLANAVDDDTAAYDRVVAAYRLPKTTDDERAARSAAIQRALREATDVPLAVMRLSADALGHAGAIAAHGNRSASSDVGVAVALLRAGLAGARLNARLNLGSVKDASYTEAVRGEIDRLAASAGRDATLAESALDAP